VTRLPYANDTYLRENETARGMTVDKLPRCAFIA
jgi:hypothetical protein